jgi:hypothetical protein
MLIIVPYHTRLAKLSSYAYARSRRAETEIQEEQVQKEYGGPQATSCMDANIALEQGKLQCITPNP